MELRSYRLTAQGKTSVRIAKRRNANHASTSAKVQMGGAAARFMYEVMELDLWKWLAVSIRKETSS
jgi:hypothetical protein